MTGTGKYQYGSGTIYIGQFLDGKAQGKGKQVWRAKPGDKYERFYDGDWVKDKMTGTGTY